MKHTLLRKENEIISNENGFLKSIASLEMIHKQRGRAEKKVKLYDFEKYFK